MLQSSTLNTPAAPTVNPAPSPWVTTEPSYTEGSTNTLYTVDLTVFTDSSFDYSQVSKSSSYEAAKAAYNKAVAASSTAASAITLANVVDAAAKGLVKASKTDPGQQQGRIWFVLNDAGNVIGMKISNGTAWTSYAMIAEDLMVVSANGTIRLKDNTVTAGNIVANSITADKLNANAFTGQTFTGSVFTAGGGTLPEVLVGPSSGIPGAGDQYGVYISTPNSNAQGSAALSVSPLGPSLEFNNSSGSATVTVKPTGIYLTSGAEIATAMTGARVLMGVYGGDNNLPSLRMYNSDNKMVYGCSLSSTDSYGYVSTGYYNNSGAMRVNMSQYGINAFVDDGDPAFNLTPAGLNLYQDPQLNFFGLNALAKWGQITRKNDSDGSGAIFFGGSDSANVWAYIALLRASDGAKVQTQGIYSRTTTSGSNMFVGGTGNLARSTSLKANKLDVEDQPVNMDLLKVPYRSWIDKQAMVDAVLGVAEIPEHRIVGSVAEELVKYAPELGAYAADGTLEGISYDRIGPALFPIIRNLLNRIEALEGSPLTEWPDSPVYDDTELMDQITKYGNEPQETEAPITKPLEMPESEV